MEDFLFMANVAGIWHKQGENLEISGFLYEENIKFLCLGACLIGLNILQCG